MTPPDETRLSDYLVTGRSLAEYQAFFALTPQDLTGRLLDCPGGAGSVGAELRALGAEAVDVDPVYGLAPERLYQLAQEQVRRSSAHTRATADGYDWVRVYPLIPCGGGSGTALPRVVIGALAEAGYACEVAPVSFRFQRGADHMLVVTRG